jgi:hypothetical protein
LNQLRWIAHGADYVFCGHFMTPKIALMGIQGVLKNIGIAMVIFVWFRFHTRICLIIAFSVSLCYLSFHFAWTIYF